MESPSAAAKLRLLKKIEKMKIEIEHRTLKKDILLLEIQQIVIENSVTEKFDNEIRLKAKTVRNLTNEIENMQDTVEYFYETLYQFIRLFNNKYYPA